MRRGIQTEFAKLPEDPCGRCPSWSCNDNNWEPMSSASTTARSAVHSELGVSNSSRVISRLIAGSESTDKSIAGQYAKRVATNRRGSAPWLAIPARPFRAPWPTPGAHRPRSRKRRPRQTELSCRTPLPPGPESTPSTPGTTGPPANPSTSNASSTRSRPSTSPEAVTRRHHPRPGGLARRPSHPPTRGTSPIKRNRDRPVVRPEIDQFGAVQSMFCDT